MHFTPISLKLKLLGVPLVLGIVIRDVHIRIVIIIYVLAHRRYTIAQAHLQDTLPLVDWDVIPSPVCICYHFLCAGVNCVCVCHVCVVMCMCGT